MNTEMSKILVVDDNAAVLTAINGMLGGKYKVYPVDRATTALAFLKKQTPDLILLDIEMPDMSGFELYREIVSFPQCKDIPVIFLSAQDDIRIEAEIFEMGGADYIRKPVNNIIITSRVETQLELAYYRKQGK